MKKEKVLIVSVVAIVIFGLIMIYSSSYIWAEYKFQDAFHYVKNQAIFAIIGFLLMHLMSKIDYHWYKEKSNMILGIAIILLILVLIPGIGSVRNGARSWFGIGPLGIQPSEAAKLALIIFTSKYLENSNKFIKNIKTGVLPILAILFLIFGLSLEVAMQ